MTAMQQQQQHNSQSSIQLKPPKPSTFHGDRRSVDTWLFEVDSYLSAFPGISEDNKLSYMVSCLRDHAVIWWQALQASRTDEQKVKTCQQFKQEFKKHYQPLQAAETARATLYRLKQTGAVKVYIERFLQQVQYLPKMDEQDKIFLFKQGLQQQVARDVSFQRPTTLFEAMEFASRSEADGRSYRAEVRSQPYNSYAQQHNNDGVRGTSASTSVPMEVAAMDNESEREEHNIYAVGNHTDGSSRIDNRQCYACKQFGHIARACPNVQKNQRTMQSYPKGQRRQ